MRLFVLYSHFFFFNDTATTEIYTLSLHDALPIWSPTTGLQPKRPVGAVLPVPCSYAGVRATAPRSSSRRRKSEANQVGRSDRKSTRLNSSHSQISYAVFCLKKKNSRRYHIHRVSI